MYHVDKCARSSWGGEQPTQGEKLLGTVEMYLCNFKVELFNKTSK